MGGNLFKLGRRPRAEYLVIEGEVRACLDGLLGDGYRIPRYYASKPDFGDLDVVVSTAAIEALGGWERFCEAIATGLGVEQSKSVGHVYSTVVSNFQVDYFVRSPELLEATYNYLSFNDLGNLIGKIFRRLGLKYGEEGLHYVFRRETQPSYKRDLLISRDWPRILAFLELDVAAWQAGFDRLEDMFAWVVASPYFSVAPYEDQDRTTERRARSRPTMARFIAWLEAEAIRKTCDYLHGPDAYVYRIDAAFPEAELTQALAQERAREGEATALRSKFGGALVREWIGLDGPQLGAFLRRFERAYPSEILASMEPEAIRAAVEAFPREG
ncbi:MAG TPA: hypothetical protein VM869_04425 [Enhygromyxa sp.]|nr:hypothetical protein [Enhygromyxa sp.]